MKLPRVIIAGTHSGSGKTTVATALVRALARSGARVQPFKVGPDYIDPGYHTAAAGRLSRNLDVWLLGEDGVREMFLRSAAGAEISVIEGVMGLYDGRGSGGEGSTAHVARILDAPVVLVLDARSMARSAAAVVLGYKSFDPELDLCGVILNRVGSERHFLFLKEAIQAATGVPVIGRVAYSPEMGLPERHLGLLPTAEKDDLARLLDLMAHKIAEALDLEELVRLARAAPALRPPASRIFPGEAVRPEVNIGLVQDRAFNFYYQDGIDLLAALGARLVPCSALEGALPPGLDGLYIGGGFPEIFAETIAQNIEFMAGVRREFGRGMPVYAECGGMMFLSRGITDFSGREYPMAGIIPGKTVMLEKRAGLGYVTARALKDNILAPAGRRIRGHEFHYSVLHLDRPDYAYLLEREGEEARPDGYASGSLLASYLHIHFAGCPEEAVNFIRTCMKYREKKSGVELGIQTSMP